MYGAGEGTRTPTPFGNAILSRARLPIPPHRRNLLFSRELIDTTISLEQEN